MPKQSPEQQDIVGRVMREFKHGELQPRDGKPIKTRNRRTLSRCTKRALEPGETAKAACR